MDIKELNKSQLILLALLLSFVTSIATGITTVTLMQQAPASVTTPINRIIKQTIERIVQVDDPTKVSLSKDQQKLLEQLKSIQSLSVSIFIRGEEGEKLLGTGFFLGSDKAVIDSILPNLQESETYVVKSILGEQKVLKIKPEGNYTIVELVENNSPNPIDPATPTDLESTP